MPTIQLNGLPHPLSSPTALPELLTELGLHGKPLVIEHNQQAILPRNFPKTTIHPGDQLEIITLAAGG